jgi:hypothetical protein
LTPIGASPGPIWQRLSLFHGFKIKWMRQASPAYMLTSGISTHEEVSATRVLGGAERYPTRVLLPRVSDYPQYEDYRG